MESLVAGIFFLFIAFGVVYVLCHILMAIIGLIGSIFGAIFGTSKAAVKSAAGKGSFSENMDREFEEMGPFQIRAVKENRDGIEVIAIQGRGIIPVLYDTYVSFITSVWDATGDDKIPIISLVDQFKEPNSTAYQHKVDFGRVEPYHGFTQWVQVGVVIPSILYPPEGGNRKLLIATRIVNRTNLPIIYIGHCDEKANGLLQTLTTYNEFHFEGKGYKESAEDRDEARCLAISLGMSVAMADGSLDDSEGNVIKEWIQKTISVFSEEKKEKLKNLYNNALRKAYSEARSGSLALSNVTKKLNQLAEEPQKYEAIELCFEVMAADGVADANELKTIKNIAEALDLDFDEIDNLRDKHLLKLDTETDRQANIETILGIDPEWTNEKVLKFLREEFAKWNSRLNTLGEGQERDNAQQMLDLIAKARKKYA